MNDTEGHWPPNPCIMPIGYTAPCNDFGLKLFTTSRQWCPSSQSHGQTGLLTASLRVFHSSTRQTNSELIVRFVVQQV